MIGSTINARFRVEREVARGGMGVVYEATDLETHQRVAVKMVLALGMDTNGPERFAREIAVLKRLDHPGIVRHIASGVSAEGAPFLVTDWVDAEPLRNRLLRTGFTPPEAIVVARQLADALGHAHQHNVVHRDIKPNNVLVPLEGLQGVKLIDFGVAGLTHGHQLGLKTLGLTRTGIAVGTPAYMAPEQIAQGRAIDARADVFGLGCLLYECLTGQRAFVGSSPSVTWLKILHSDPPSLRSLCPSATPAMELLLARMLAKDATERPADGAAVVAALDALGKIPDGSRRRTSPSAISAAAVLTSATPGTPIDGLGTVTLGQMSTPVPAQPWAVLLMVSRPSDQSTNEWEESPARAAWDAKVTAICDRHGLPFVDLPDGGRVSLRRAADVSELVRSAARCALELKRALPECAVSITSGEASDPMAHEALLERAANVAQTSALESIFGDFAEPEDQGFQGVRVCTKTVQWLQKPFEWVESGDAFRLMG